MLFRLPPYNIARLVNINAELFEIRSILLWQSMVCLISLSFFPRSFLQYFNVV